ncbi:MAG: metal ABC transporter permease [Phycisphaerae bacterium]|nr:metal ABC transporter permease [Phycisphaerae bacterium]
MRTIEYLSDPLLRGHLLPPLVAALALAICGSLLSVLVVLKRMSFIGQGVSHSAFGGVGLAALLSGLISGGLSPVAQYAVVLVFCAGAALAVATLGDRKSLGMDTAIGVLLVSSMALGAVLLSIASRMARSGGTSPPIQGWESILFGSILGVGWADAAVACGVSATVCLAIGWWRRPLLLWAFDEAAAPAFGVPVARMKLTLVLLLAATIVTGMKVAGVVLATALLVLPGAAAIAISRRLLPVFVCSVAVGVVGLLGGMILSFERGWPTGACIVLVLTVIVALAWVVGRARSVRARPGQGPAVNPLESA